jgi:hypothetical protein
LFWESFDQGAQADYPEGYERPGDRELADGALDEVFDLLTGKPEPTGYRGDGDFTDFGGEA